MSRSRNRVQTDQAASVAYISRTRRAALQAEFEWELGIDHKQRAAAAAAAARWVRVKTFIVWAIALLFFAVACHQLWVLSNATQGPFNDPLAEYRHLLSFRAFADWLYNLLT